MYKRQLYYTPKTYAQHLKKIIRILETHEDYHFVPLEGQNDTESSLMVKGNHRALLVHNSKPFTVFEISSRKTSHCIVNTCSDLRKKLATPGYIDLKSSLGCEN